MLHGIWQKLTSAVLKCSLEMSKEPVRIVFIVADADDEMH